MMSNENFDRATSSRTLILGKGDVGLGLEASELIWYVSGFREKIKLLLWAPHLVEMILDKSFNGSIESKHHFWYGTIVRLYG